MGTFCLEVVTNDSSLDTVYTHEGTEDGKINTLPSSYLLNPTYQPSSGGTALSSSTHAGKQYGPHHHLNVGIFVHHDRIVATQLQDVLAKPLLYCHANLLSNLQIATSKFALHVPGAHEYTATGITNSLLDRHLHVTGDHSKASIKRTLTRAMD